MPANSATFIMNEGYYCEEESVLITNTPLIAVKNDWRRLVHHRVTSASPRDTPWPSSGIWVAGELGPGVSTHSDFRWLAPGASRRRRWVLLVKAMSSRINREIGERKDDTGWRERKENDKMREEAELLKSPHHSWAEGGRELQREGGISWEGERRRWRSRETSLTRPRALSCIGGFFF